jgi:hypothetical protein
LYKKIAARKQVIQKSTAAKATEKTSHEKSHDRSQIIVKNDADHQQQQKGLQIETNHASAYAQPIEIPQHYQKIM